MIEFRSVSKTYAGSDGPVVNDLSFEVLEGEICVLVGPSGCGKTTTMRMVNRLIEPTEGEILIDGEPNTAMSGTQLQAQDRLRDPADRALPPPHHRRKHRDRAWPPGLGQRAHKRARRRAAWSWWGLTLTTTATATRPSSRAASSSGSGWRARWPRTPRSCSWTSPSGRSTRSRASGLQEEFLNIQKNIKKTIVFVTHDIDEAIRMGDKIAILKQGGFLAQYDSPENILDQPGLRFRRLVRRGRPGSSNGSRCSASRICSSNRPTGGADLPLITAA